MVDSFRADPASRMADMQRSERRRLMESRLMPLPMDEESRRDETVSVPVDLLVGRFHDVEAAVAEVRSNLTTQIALMRATSRRVEMTLAAMILAMGGALIYGWSALPNPAASARPAASYASNAQ